MKSSIIERQFGLWDSPISPIRLARGIVFKDVLWSSGGDLVWLEMRSDRGVIVIQPADGQATRDLNTEFSVRAKVGYGGGDFTVGGEWVYFVEAQSGRIFRQPLRYGSASAISPAFGFSASPSVSPNNEWLLYVHTYEGHDMLVIADVEGNYWPQKLVAGEDFYMQPTWHPDGSHIAWVAWDHPNMPWDGTFLRIGKLQFSESSLPIIESIHTVAGSEQIPIFQPEFSPDGRYLAFVSEESGWWQLYLYDLEDQSQRQLTAVPVEHGAPAWIQGMRTYGFDPNGEKIFVLRNQDGNVSLWQIDLNSGEEHRFSQNDEYSYMEQISVSRNGIALIGSGGRTPPRIISYQPANTQQAQLDHKNELYIWRRATSEELQSGAYSLPASIQWQGMDGGKVHGLFYPPHNVNFEGTGKPPLIINIHGGPTGQVYNSFNQRAQFFATRGYAVLEVNHRGSTGYGREYRNQLRGNWGVYDVQDAVSGANDLIKRGEVDAGKIVIMGGSAGGFTVLKAMEDYPGFFKAGICLYGVANHFTLAAETHKFEAHYLDTMLGSLPESAALYRERSPIFYAEKIQDAIAIFQGEDDQVVPRKQSDEIVDVLSRRGVAHIYHVYPDEGHGFRKTETIEHYYKTIEQFLRNYVIFA